MYSFSGRVRYSELDGSGHLSLKSMMDYLQDCSTFQSESLGLGIRYLQERKKAWWLSSWNIDILSLPVLGQEIRISTWAHDFKGIYGYRCFAIQDEQGEYMVKADSTWFFFDLEKRCPARPDPEQILPYMQSGAEALDIEILPKKTPHIEGGRYLEPIKVQKHHLDTNEHVNNAVYIYMARDCLDSAAQIGGIAVWYKKMALLGDVLYPYVAEEEKHYTVELNDAEGGHYAYIRMKKR